MVYVKTGESFSDESDHAILLYIYTYWLCFSHRICSSNSLCVSRAFSTLI